MEIIKCCHNVTESDEAFVGIKIKNDKVDVYFPLGYQIPSNENDCIHSIFDLIKAINIVNLEKIDKKISNNNDLNDIPLDSYIWLIQDYLLNGLYYDNEKNFKQNQNGKINWKRTLKTKFYVSRGNAIYLNPIVEKNFREENIITDIEIFCLKKCLSKIGWLFKNISLPNSRIIEDNQDFYLKVLKTKLMNSYNDYKKQLINNLIVILEDKSSKSYNKTLKFGTLHFNIVWEKMISSVYDDIKNKSFFPKAKYNLIGKKPFDTPSTEPDTIIEDNNNLYILDSKYYKYGITNNNKDLPSTNSIDKQIAYAKFNAYKHKYHNIYNAFILPFTKKEGELPVKYIGYAESGNTLYSYEKIAVILIDTKYIMDCYFHKNTKDTNELITEIHKVDTIVS